MKDLKYYFKKALSKFIPFFVTSIILVIALMFSALLFIIPAIILGIYWAFANQVILLKDKKYITALTYSKDIVKNRWWRVLGYAIVFGIIGLGVSLVLIPVSVISQLFVMFVPFVGFIFGAIGNTIMQFVYIFFIVLSVVFFINFDATKIESEEKKEEDSEDGKIKENIEESLT